MSRQKFEQELFYVSRDNILRKAILFLLTLGCLEETLGIASIDFFKRYC